MLTADILGPDLIIVIVVAVIVLLFGGSKLPKLARGLGSASHEFKKGLEEGSSEARASDPQAVGTAPVVPPVVPPAVPPVANQAPQWVNPVPESGEAAPKDTSQS